MSTIRAITAITTPPTPTAVSRASIQARKHPGSQASRLAGIQAGNSLTLNSQAALQLYSNSNDWYCGYLFGGCNYTENTRTISDYFSETALLQINYTPDSAPTVSANALTVAGGTSALGFALTYAWVFSLGVQPGYSAWVFSNGPTASGANPLINFASPAWASGLYTAT
jgi:hypothetical protein